MHYNVNVHRAIVAVNDSNVLIGVCLLLYFCKYVDCRCACLCVYIYIYIYCILALKYICNYKFSTLSVVMSNGLNPCKGPSKDICCMSTRQDQIKECFKVFCCFGFDVIIFVSNLLSSSLLYRHYITLC